MPERPLPAAAGVGGITCSTVIVSVHGSTVLAVLVFVIPQLTAIFLTIDAILTRRRYQRLHDDIARAGLALCQTPDEAQTLLTHIARTHPGHLGPRLSHQNPASPPGLSERPRPPARARPRIRPDSKTA